MSEHSSSNWLSVNDSTVLNALFDPESSLSRPSSNIDATSDALPNLSIAQLQTLKSLELDIIRLLDTRYPAQDMLDEALERLNGLIAMNPQYPSAYANRAQARRLLLGDDELTLVDSNIITLILADLSVAINLASPSSTTSPVSSFQAKILSNAHTHRAYLLQRIAKSRNPVHLLELLGAGDVEELEEAASRDFYMGGSFGDERAQQMSVATNPYAKLCGAIVKEAMKKEVEDSFISV